MALIIADRVQETSTTTGTGTLTLAGAVTGFRTFGSVMANGDTIYYTITDQLSSANWEVGVGTWSTGGTLARTTILESSTGSAVNFTSGALYVFGTYAADKAVYKDLNDKVGLTASTTGSSNQGAIYYGTLGFSDANTLASLQSSVNTYNQLVVQNTNNGSAASADLTICNDISTSSAYYANFGINSSGWGGTLGTNSLNAPSVTYLTATSADLVIGTTTSNNLRFVVGGGADVLTVDTVGDFGFGVTTPSATLHIKPGTAAAGTAPIKINSGTLMTAAEAGAVEYDGKLNYFTPAGTSRALTPSSYFYRKNTSTVLTSNNTAQSWLGLTNGVTLQASTIYYVDGEFELTTTGTTSHTEAIGFTLTTATLSAATGILVRRNNASTTAANGFNNYITSTASGTTVITGALTTSQTVVYAMRGMLSVNAAGQVNPVIQFSAGPGGTSTIIAGAWIRFTPIGTTGSNVSIGTWA